MQPVPLINIICMIIEMLLALAIPIAAIWYWLKKKKASIIPVLIGAASFFISTQVFESLFHTLFLLVIPFTANFLNNPDNFWVYVIYGSFMAGIFEETGRLVCFKLMKKHWGAPENAVSYGLGHGGFECAYLIGVTMGLYTVLAIAINLGVGEEVFAALGAADPAASATVLTAINSMSPLIVLAAICERISAMTLHVCNSVLVYRGVMTGKYSKYIIAIGTHAAFNAIALFMSQYFGIAVTEIVLLITAAAFAFYVFKVKKGEV